MLPIHFHVPLHGDYRHAERLHNFFRPHGPSHDHLTREHPEAPYICLLVLKHRQVSVHITHLAVLGFYRDPTVNLGHSGWKDWQLQLWHPSSYQQLATARNHFPAHSDFIDPWKKSGEVRMSEVRRSPIPAFCPSTKKGFRAQNGRRLESR